MNPLETPQIPPADPLAGLSEIFFALFALGLLVWLGLRLWGRSRSNLMRVIARLPLEGRRSLYLVETAGSFFLIGAGEGGLSTLAELDAAKVRAAIAAAGQHPKPLASLLLSLWQGGAAPKAPGVEAAAEHGADSPPRERGGANERGGDRAR